MLWSLVSHGGSLPGEVGEGGGYSSHLLQRTGNGPTHLQQCSSARPFPYHKWWGNRRQGSACVSPTPVHGPVPSPSSVPTHGPSRNLRPRTSINCRSSSRPSSTSQQWISRARLQKRGWGARVLKILAHASAGEPHVDLLRSGGRDPARATWRSGSGCRRFHSSGTRRECVGETRACCGAAGLPGVPARREGRSRQ